MKKELIAVSSYCPTIEKKQTLLRLITKLQELRESFDILIVSHSPIDIILMEMVDFVHYDKNNELLTDFDLTNGFYYQNNSFHVESTLVYPESTHLACFSLLYNSINFAKFRNYKKFHWIEYDFLPENIDVICKSSKILDTYDNFMIKDPINSWVYGSYLSFKIDNLEFKNNGLDLNDQILNELKNHSSNNSEHIIQSLLSKDNRSTHYCDLNSLILKNNNISSIDSHFNSSLNWIVPVYNKKTDNITIFIYNNWGLECNITVIVDGKASNFTCPPKLGWSFKDVLNITDGEHSIAVCVDNKITKEIIINESNLDNFKKYNNIKFK